MAYQTVSLNFGMGLDTRTDPKMVIPTKLTLLQNAIFTDPYRVTKRKGYTQMPLNTLEGGVITNPTMTRSYRNELLLAGTSTGGNRLFSWSADELAWGDVGKYTSVAVSKKIIAAPELNWVAPGGGSAFSFQTGTANSSGALIGSLVAYAFDQSNQGQANPVTGAGVYWAVYDDKTGNSLFGPPIQILSPYGNTWGYSKVVALGASIFAIFYISDTSPTISTAPVLAFQTLTITPAGYTLGPETILGLVTKNPGFTYDVVTTVGGAFVAFSASHAAPNRLTFVTINSAGTPTGSAFNAEVGTASLVSIVLDSTGTNAWIYWVANGGGDIYYTIYNAATLAMILGTTIARAGVSNVQQVTAFPTSAVSQRMYWSIYTQPATLLTIGVFYPIINLVNVSSTGVVGTPEVFIDGFDIYGKTFTVSGRNYLPIVNLSQSQSTGFIIDIGISTSPVPFEDSGTGIASAKFLQTECEGLYEAGPNVLSSAYSAPILVAVRYPGFLNPPIIYSPTLIGLPSGFVVSLWEEVPDLTTNNLSAAPDDVTIGAQMGVASITFDFNNIDAYQGIIQQDTTVLNGGIVSQYDGAQVTELGFNVDPDGVSLLGIASGGGLIGSSIGNRFVYYVTYEWTDANGNLHQSAPSLPVTVIFSSGSGNSVQIQWAACTLSQKQNITNKVWRTIANGTIAYLVVAVRNNEFGTGINTYTDTESSDAFIIDNPTLYTEGGSILENIAPPPSMILWTNNNRAWAIDSENPQTTIEYSKTASPGSGIAFSTGQLEYVIDSRAGVITGASPMDEKTVILKAQGVGYFIGDGANDAGNGATLSNFQIVPSDVGCVNSKSVILYPDGIIFKSPKGIYAINRGVQVYYFGADVQQYNNQDIQSAILTAYRTQIRFLTSAGVSLVYDYNLKQWSTFTNHDGYSATVWNDPNSNPYLYVYVRTDGNVYLENNTSYLDNVTPFALFAQTAWIKATATQNFERVRQFELLGDFNSPVSDSTYAVQLSFAYDFVPNFYASAPYYLPLGTGIQSAFQDRIFTKRQKCNAIQVQIAELPTGAIGEYMDFSDLGLEISSKTGLNKLPGARSVG
jgi:hypothetical protein